MRRAVPFVATACALGGPTVLAFYSGGYFSQPRVIAGVVVWSLVLALAVVGPAPLPRSLPGALALGGLAAVAAWSAVSVLWAPLAGPAMESVQRLVLYVGALMLGIGALRLSRAVRAVEPALAGGAVVVIGYGLSGRLLPGIVELAQSARAGGWSNRSPTGTRRERWPRPAWCCARASPATRPARAPSVSRRPRRRRSSGPAPT